MYKYKSTKMNFKIAVESFSKMFIKIVILILIIHVNRGYCQVEYEPMTFASPNASSFSKYGQLPVSMYTGIPQISIPLYTVIEGDIEVPISINYHASGIKVEDKASSVGLGWSLNAGGNISRQVRGLIDNGPDGFINYGGGIVSDLTSDYTPLFQKQELLQWPLFGINFTGEQRGHLRDISDGRCDGESDIYYFSFPSGSGKFFIKNNGQVLLMPHQNYQIDILGYNWRITDQQGRKYRFITGDHIYSDGGNSFPYTNDNYPAQYLDSITDQFNNTVRFSYRSHTSNYYDHYSDEIVITSGSDTKSNWVFNNSTCMYLDTIVSSNQKVIFYSSFNRIDIDHEAILDSIKVFDNNNLVIKKIKFHHSYFVGTPESFWFPDPYSHLRLRLDSLSVDNMVYRFGYNNIPLPSRHSNSQDAWGYYNAAQNPSLIPNYFAYERDGIYTAYDGANRCPNPDVVQAGILNDITYPTGGITHFEFEPNQVYAQQFDSMPALVPYRDSVIISPVTGTFDVRLGHDLIVPFTVHFGDLKMHFLISMLPDTIQWSQRIDIELLKSDGTIVMDDFIPNTITATGLRPDEYLLRIRGLVNYSSYHSVQITWKTPVYDINDHYDPFISKVVGGLRIKSIVDYNRPGSIAQITNYKYVLENNENISSGMVFKYPIFNRIKSPRFTIYKAGCLTLPTTPCEFTPCIYDIMQLISRSAIPIQYNTDNLIEYSSVIKEIGENANGGRSIYIFTDSHTDPDFKIKEGYDYETSPYTSVAWNRGLPLTEKHFLKTTDGFTLIKEVENYYSKITSTGDSSRCSMGMALRIAGAQYFDGTFHWFECDSFVEPESNSVMLAFWRPYLTLSGWNKLDSTRSISYFGEGSVTETTTYDYNEPNQTNPFLLLKQKDMKTSSGDVLREKYKYPSDYTNLQSDIGLHYGVINLNNKHIVDKVIEKSIFKKRSNESAFKLVSSVFVEHKFDMGVPSKINQIENSVPLTGFIPSYSSNGRIYYDSQYKLNRVFDQYDILGNLLQTHSENDISTCYIYGYNDTYAVAKVSNSDYNEIAYTSFEERITEQNVGFGNWELENGGWSVTTNSITGKYALIRTGGSSIRTHKNMPPGKYRITCWTKGQPVFFQGAQIMIKEQFGLWTYTEAILNISSMQRINVSVANAGIIDELRLYPIDASMETFTYDGNGNITSKFDNNSKGFKYTYDTAGRLILTLDHEGNILKRYKYNYAQ
jgi:YD repeat-containing protein